MLDFLKKANISDSTIDYIKETFPSSTVANLEDSQEECLKTISLFRKLGIKEIEELLKYETYIFVKLTNEIADRLSKYNIKEVVEEINEDYVSIEKYI